MGTTMQLKRKRISEMHNTRKATTCPPSSTTTKPWTWLQVNKYSLIEQWRILLAKTTREPSMTAKLRSELTQPLPESISDSSRHNWLLETFNLLKKHLSKRLLWTQM